MPKWPDVVSRVELVDGRVLLYFTVSDEQLAHVAVSRRRAEDLHRLLGEVIGRWRTSDTSVSSASK